MRKLDTRHWWWIGLVFIALVYLHNTLPHLTMMPRVNVDEPWLIERAYQVLHTGVPSQPMLGLHQAYLLQVGYGYLLAPWVGLFGVGLDNQDEHQRITTGDEFLLVGGSEETHERMQDVAIHVTEALKNKGKRLQDACAAEVIDLVHKAMDR